MKKDRYPLPCITNLLDSPRKAKIYSKINLGHAYHLVQIQEGDKWKMAFQTRYGSFEWRVMHFGLTNAPTAFQRFMNDIFGDLLNVCILVYLDNILIYSDSKEEHQHHVREILRRLQQHHLYAHADKCFFHISTVKYLGYILSLSSVTMASDKVQVIQDWAEPRKIKDIQSFLGFANFYWRFIPKYSEITVPLTHLTHKGSAWDFSEKCCSAFTSLKQAFTTAPILAHWIPGMPLIVEMDTLDYALTAILSTISPTDGEIHPIAFHSQTFTLPELNYDVHDKELLAIFEAFKIWCHYLEGSPTPVNMVTDHKNLEYFSTTKSLTP